LIILNAADLLYDAGVAALIHRNTRKRVPILDRSAMCLVMMHCCAKKRYLMQEILVFHAPELECALDINNKSFRARFC